jgi:hypothetical protein
MKIVLVSFFILFRLLLFSQENGLKQIVVVKDTMITDRSGLIWNCMLYSDSTSKVSFFGFKCDSKMVKYIYSDKMGAYFLKKVLGLNMKIKENEQKINIQTSSNYIKSLYTESYQIYTSSSPKNNKLTLNDYCYLINFFSKYSKNDIVYSENGFQLGYGIEYELNKTKLISIQLRFNKLPTYQNILENNNLLDELDFYLYFSIWNQKDESTD